MNVSGTTQSGQVAWRHLRAEDGDRVGVKGDDARGERKLAGFVAQALKQRLVSQVDTVQDADGERGFGAGRTGSKLRGCE